MIRERALKAVLVLVGLLFSAAVYPLVSMHLEEALRMMLSVYATLGIFLLLASRDPSANRSLIGFTAWSSFAHAAVMAVQVYRNLIPRGERVGDTFDDGDARPCDGCTDEKEMCRVLAHDLSRECADSRDVAACHPSQGREW